MSESSPLPTLASDRAARFHFVGVGGTGMSALAQLRAFSGGRVSGSDRSFDGALMALERKSLERLGVQLFPQDGRGVAGASAVVVSTAIEDSIPDVAAAKRFGIPIFHRADLLAHHVSGSSVAIAGTSGKSTVTGMVFEILRAAGRDPGLVTGGRLLSLMRKDHYGNAWWGEGPIVVEADESDGSLVRHAPECGVLLNLHRDHMEPERVLEQFRVFRDRTRGPFVVSDDAELAEFRDRGLVFGFSNAARVRGDELRLDRDGSTFEIDGVPFRVNHPGLHNAWNALAAVAAARALDVPLRVASEALEQFAGIHRRFELVGKERGVEVVDDFAHNPQKLRAVLEAAKGRAPRVIALFQPHGFAPMRFLRDELTRELAAALRPDDRLYFAPIYFAGGTVAQDISSETLIADIRAAGAPHAEAIERDAFPALVSQIARDGDLVLVLGARDPALPRLASDVAAALRGA